MNREIADGDRLRIGRRIHIVFSKRNGRIYAHIQAPRRLKVKHEAK